ncbi:tRNA pseudouridine synthase C [Tenacibaculum sp. MAR_2009_124]|uniref:pseudouridine synthase n=1 Tax=Tenacibaculum sp. MAR_2009_124 TaxID=1250059 RepID=UPI00089C0F1E|nr:pseudouridine synthase [Tenacibaculum sp. MAR_2009_124]SEB43854.1 tRNA pseudouridine synthase C [Tenacibaculum sp. MAR_2009_124]
MSLEIIYQDEYIVCVSKPNNVVVHHAHHSRNVVDEKSLLQLLQEQLGEKLYPVHRLDRKTSGIILLTRETKFVSDFQKLFTDNAIIKRYFGIVRGHAPERLIIDSPVKGRDSDVYKEAETLLEAVNQITLDIPVKPYDTSRYSLVRLTPKTGRLHQLRIHTNKISHPLIGDPKYGDKNHNLMYQENFNCGNLFLHAKTLEFQHPYLKKELILSTSLPEDWKTILQTFNWSISE